MKTNWLILGTMLATTAVAQVNQPKPAPASHPVTAPATPAPMAPVAPVATPPPLIPPAAATSDVKTNAPAKKALKAKKTAVKKEHEAKHEAKHEEKVKEKAAKAEKISVKNEEKKALEAEVAPTLVPGSAVVTGEAVNLRGQAGLNGEVVGHVKKGDSVTVLAEINLDKPKAGEPAKWAKISLPASEKVWVNAKYLDITNNVVVATKLNVRGGPGENFSVLGVVEKGASITRVTPLVAKDGLWLEIQPPANAFAFISANLLKQESSMPVEKPVAVLTPTPTPVIEAPMIVPHVFTPPPPPIVVPPPVMPVMTMPVPTPVLAADTDTNPPPRIVTHEGSVRPSVSPVAPSDFELFDPANDKAIDYIYSPSTNLNLARYDGMHITVTGEEAMDPRWKDTPVLNIQKIFVISAPAGAKSKNVKSK